MKKFAGIMKGIGVVVKYAGAVMVLIEGIEWTYNRFKEKFGDFENGEETKSTE